MRLLSLCLRQLQLQGFANYIEARFPQGLAQGDGGIVSELAPVLSPGSAITLPWGNSWQQLLQRASAPRISPDYVAVVEVATEKDVQETIKYANRHGLPFLAVSGTHGWQSTLDNVKSGIQINMRRMNETKLHKDGKIATVGGGVMQHEITSALWEHKKRAVTGLCECVSAIGPLLGGGHSLLQHRHGFAADNLVSARVVLADGKAVTVSSTKQPELFWALRGAGHNFGVVTSFELKVYDVPKQDYWTIRTLTFTQDKLERFFETWNELEVKYEDPGLLVVNAAFLRLGSIDESYPSITLQLLYEGKKTKAIEYEAAFSAVGPVYDNTRADITWGDLYKAGGLDLSSPVCRKNNNMNGFPNSLTRWDPKAMRKGFAIFTEATADRRFSTSTWPLESYGRGAVETVPDSATAVPSEERRRHILTSPILWWVGSDKKDAEDARRYGEKMQMALRTPGQVPHSYLNYAKGSEELSEVYGRDKPRLARLRELKKKWDPKNRFGFYMPIH